MNSSQGKNGIYKGVNIAKDRGLCFLYPRETQTIMQLNLFQESQASINAEGSLPIDNETRSQPLTYKSYMQNH